MHPAACLRLLAVALLAPTTGAACTGDVTPNTTRVLPTPEPVLRASVEPGRADAASDEPRLVAAPGGTTSTRDAATAAPEAPAKVELTHLTLDAYKAKLAQAGPKDRFTIVDAWATFCAPCKENFPHLVEMHQKYSTQGLRVISLTLDDPAEAMAVRDAEKFLTEQKAVFSNVIIDGDPGDLYEFLDISAIPAVFVYGPDGKQLKRFTLDDPNNQFTYEQVEQYVKGLLAGKSEP